MQLPTGTIFHLFETLRPDLNDQQTAKLRQQMTSESYPWITLLTLANLHRVTLIWSLRLQQHGLEGEIPQELRNYLEAQLEGNRHRNRKLMTALTSCLERFNQEGVDVLLLKGAAALADGLYEDPGCRLMSDIDMLVKPEELASVDRLMNELGFEISDADRHNRFFEGHHHLPPYYHKEWDVCIEVHKEITDFRARKAFPLERLFNRARTVEWEGLPVKVLHDADRLLHNACHAMQQNAGWLCSWCSLHELVEWDQLLRRTPDIKLFPEIDGYADKGGFARPLRVYALLANQLFGSPVPDEWAGGREQRHVERFVAGLAWKGTERRTPAVVRRYYLFHVLPWSWSTHHFSRQDVSFARRVWHFAKLAVRPDSWKRLRL